MPKAESGKGEVRKALARLDRRATRAEAIARLVELGAVEAMEPLLKLSQRAKGEEREAVCEALSRIAAAGPSEQVIPPLIERGMASRYAAVRRCTLCALGAMGDKAQPGLKQVLRALRDKDPGVRLAAIEALGRIGDPRAIEPLLKLLGDSDRNLRTQAMDSLAALGEAAAEALCGLLQMEAEGRRAQRERMVRAQVAAAHVLGQVGGSTGESSLRQAYADGRLAAEIRVAALSALGKAFAERALPTIAEALRDGDASVRHQAVRCLCDIPTAESSAWLVQVYREGTAGADEKACRLALKGLRDRYPWLLEQIRAGDHTLLPVLLAVWRSMGKGSAEDAEQIAQALAGMGRPLVPALTEMLDVHAPCADVVRVLRKMGSEAIEAYPALVLQLGNADVRTCCAAARALGALGDERAVAPLSACLVIDRQRLEPKKHKGAWRRAAALQRAAAAGLGALGKAGLPSALEAARSDDALTRRGGALALGYIGGGQALRALDGMAADVDPLVREAAAEAIERAGAGDVTRLGRMLHDENDRVRARAVEALGRLDDLRSLDLLLRAYGDGSELVRKAVVKALAQREGERAYSVLIAAAAGGNVSALRALEEHPTVEAIPALLEALDSPWSEVYTAAAHTVRRYVEVFGAGRAAFGEPDQGEQTARQSDSNVSTGPLALLRRAIPLLTSLLQDESADVRRVALEALGAFRDPAIVPHLAVLLSDRHGDIRSAALCAIEAGCVNPAAWKAAEKVLRAYVKRETKRHHVDKELRTKATYILEQIAEARVGRNSPPAGQPGSQASPSQSVGE